MRKRRAYIDFYVIWRDMESESMFFVVWMWSSWSYLVLGKRKILQQRGAVNIPPNVRIPTTTDICDESNRFLTTAILFMPSHI